MNEILIIIKAVLLIIAAMSKAAADTIVHHPLKSKLKGTFWKPWPHDKFIPFTKYPWDGWHLCNSLMLASLIALPFVDLFLVYKWYIVIGAYMATGIIFTIVFNLFYNKILVKK